MASCKQVESMIQAWIDGELGDSERVILDQHFQECPLCTITLRKQQRCAALLFEGFADHRLRHSIRQRVMENLPEMEPLRVDLEGVNWRGHDTKPKRAWLGPLMRMAAVFILICLASLLYSAWPKGEKNFDGAVGMITQTEGAAFRETGHGLFCRSVALKDFVKFGAFYKTGPNSHLMVSLRGPTQLRIDENTRFQICDDRKIRVETGRVALDVSRDERKFRVLTPSGTITVYGTVFEVSVDSVQTLVTLQSGALQVESAGAQGELKPGEQTCFTRGQNAITTRTVDTAQVLGWTKAIMPDSEAYDRFAREVQPLKIAELPGEQVFAVITTKNGKPRAVSSFCLAWNPATDGEERCGYDVHVYNEAMHELFSVHVDGSVFANPNRRSHEIDAPGAPIVNAGVLHVKIVPDNSAGKQTPLKVSAVGL